MILTTGHLENLLISSTMASNPAPVYKIHNIGLHGSGSSINDKLVELGSGGSVAQGEVWREGPSSMKGPCQSSFQ